MRFCFRCSPCSVVCLALLYIVIFNGLSLYGLIKSTYTPVSLPVNRRNLYLAYLRYDRSQWKCKTPHLSKRPLPLTALASFPGSGNTWIRHILQQATGILTGSVYNDRALKLGGFLGEGIRNSSVLVIKTHEEMNTRTKFQRVILIVRNPKDALLAEFNRMRGGHIGYAKREDFNIDWKTHVNNSARNWFNMNKSWLHFSGDLHVVRYEELKAHPNNEIQQLLDFLRVNISQKELRCVCANLRGLFKRPARNITDPNTKEMTDILMTYEKEINRLVDQRFRFAKRHYS